MMLRRFIFALSALPVLIAPGTAQKGGKFKKEYWKVDPYTKNDPTAMKKAGYTSFGPFTWSDDHDSNDIKKMFPTTPMLFVETAHFKIGSSLGLYNVPKAAKLEKKILKTELTRLKQLFPKIKTSLRKLDPWLRLHLFAMRLEDTYADFCKRIEVTDADFPKKNQGTRIAGAATDKKEKYMGQGPYLGMRGKFLVLLMTKGGNLNRYAARALGGRFRASSEPDPQRTYFTKVGSLFFGTACECGRRSLYNDHALHCHVVFNTVQSMVDGYKDFFFSVPVWTREGLSHWYLFNIDPKEHCFSGIKGRSNSERYDHRWAQKIKKRVRHGDFTAAAEVTRYMQFDQLTFGDHMAIWSRIDFLQSLGSEKFGRFMGKLKAMIPVEAGKAPTEQAVFAQQETALREAYGFDYAGFDAAWKKFVLKTYPNR